MELGPDADEFKIKQHPNLKLAQSGYKRSILFNPEKDILGTIMRVAYPSLALPRRQRSERDTGIIRLVVYLLRNLAAIDEDRNRSDTILAFQKANALDFLCVLASGMGDEFIAEDVIVLDIMYYLLRGVDVTTIFDLAKSGSDTVKTDLADLLTREKNMKTNNKKQAHTRHNRFGTMVSVVSNSRRFTVASQTAIVANLSGNNFAGIEASKKWNKPQRQIKTQEDVDLKISLNTEARLAVKAFISTFLDAGFNPLFSSILKALEHDDTRVSQSNRLQFLYLQGWFFRALREHGKAKQKKENLGSDFSDDAEYQLVASMMESRGTIMLRKMLRESIESKLWKETHAAMECLKELLLTIHSMSMSSDAEYQDIAENLQSNLYYEESNLDLIATCVRTYSNQSLGYLNACTDLATVLLKMLEKFASTKTHMFVRARRQRQRKKDQKKAPPSGAESDDEEAEANARDAVKERAFSFAKFEHRFMNDHSVDTFIAFLEFYADLTSDQIKRGINFLHRVFVKQKVELLLYRLEIFELLNRMVQDKIGLPARSPARIEVENFTSYMFKRFTRMIQECPALAWEILFEKLSNDPYYLTHDQDKAPLVKAPPRAPAEFEVRPGFGHEEQIKIAVGVLLDENKTEFLDWLRTLLGSIVTRRYAWEAEHRSRNREEEDTTADAAAAAAVAKDIYQPCSESITSNEGNITSMLFKDGKARLLLKLLQFERLGDREDVDAMWICPSTLETDQIKDDLELIKKYSHSPPTFEADKTAIHFIRRQVIKRDSIENDTTTTTTADEDEDSDGNYEIVKRPVKKSNKKRTPIKEIDYDEIEARRLKRQEMEEVRQGQIKSSKYVHESDEEDDEVANTIFFAAEAALRERQKQRASSSLHSNTATSKKEVVKTMQNTLFVPDDDDDNVGGGEKKRMGHGNALFVGDESDSDRETTTTNKRVKMNNGRRLIINSDDDE